MAKRSVFMLLKVTLFSSSMLRNHTFQFPWQQQYWRLSFASVVTWTCRHVTLYIHYPSL